MCIRDSSWVVHEETYGRRALPGEDPHDLLAETVAQIRPLDAKALGEAWERQKRMTKPAGALGMLEIISAQLSGLSRQCPPPIPEPAAVAIFAGDHRDLHRLIRRQRQMCIRDRGSAAGGGTAPGTGRRSG